MLSVFIIIIVLFYLVLIGCFVWGFDQVPVFNTEGLPEKHKFSVIIPFRNEAKSLSLLLDSIKQLQYPKSHFELLFIDDASQDDSVVLIEKTFKKADYNYTILKNNRQSQSPKKDAITTAIATAKYEWIITTDADCSLPKLWLICFNEFIQKKKPKVIVAPVTLHKPTAFFDCFQLLDVLSLQGVTIGGFGIKNPIMANGANLAYHKSVFTTIGGFSTNNNIASGDDIFLLENALKHFPKAILYIKSTKAIVTTKAELTLKKYFHQRLRWASKSNHYSSIFTKFTGIIVFLINATFICFLLVAIAGYFSLPILLYLFLIKFLIDFLLIFKTARFFNQTYVFPTYLISAFLYPFITVFITVTSVFSSYKWKGRTFKK